MLTLSDAMAAVLRDLAQARAQADLTTREIAIAYAKDPVLKHFSVPRADIREASVDVTMALAPVGEGDSAPDSRAVALAVGETAEKFRDAAMTVQVVRQAGNTSRRVQLARLAAAERKRLDEVFAPSLNSVVRSSLDGLASAFMDDREKFRQLAGESLLKALPAALQQADIPAQIDEGSQKSAIAAAAQWEQAIAERLQPKAGAASVDKLSLAVDLRPDVLQKLPAHALSRVTLTVALEGYDILEPEEGDKDGDSGLPKLRPR